MSVTELPSVAELRDAPPREDCEGLGQPEVLARVPGLTVRQLDFWSRTERLHPHTHQGHGGSGRPRCWPLAQVETAARVLRLTRLGLTLDAAFHLAGIRRRLTVASEVLAAIAADMPEHVPTTTTGAA